MKQIADALAPEIAAARARLAARYRASGSPAPIVLPATEAEGLTPVAEAPRPLGSELAAQPTWRMWGNAVLPGRGAPVAAAEARRRINAACGPGTPHPETVRAFWFLLVRLARGTRVCGRGYRTLGRMVQRSRETFRRSIRLLERAGLVLTAHTAVRSSRFTRPVFGPNAYFLARAEGAPAPDDARAPAIDPGFAPSSPIAAALAALAREAGFEARGAFLIPAPD